VPGPFSRGRSTFTDYTGLKATGKEVSRFPLGGETRILTGSSLESDRQEILGAAESGSKTGLFLIVSANSGRKQPCEMVLGFAQKQEGFFTSRILPN
jgi:hypothetical protein